MYAGPAFAPPVRYHSRLRQRERQECPDGEKRDQPIGHATKENQQDAAYDRQRDDAPGVDESAAALSQRSRKIAVLCNQAAQPRKVCEGRIGRKREDQQYRANRDEVKDVASGHGSDELRKHALISGS